jgi:hypothetical protein
MMAVITAAMSALGAVPRLCPPPAGGSDACGTLRAGGGVAGRRR